MAGGTVKSVSVVYQAFTDKFEAAIDRTGKKMGGFVKKTAAAATGFIAVRAGVQGVIQSFHDLNQLAKDINALDVGPDFLRGFGAAVEDAGGTMENAKDIIREFNIRMGEARMGSGPAVDALKALGLSVEDIGQGEEGLMTVIDSLSQLEDQAVKTFLAGDLAGGPMEDWINAMDPEKIKHFIQNVKEFEGVITKEDLNQIMQAHRAMNELGRVIGGIGDQIAIALGPSIKDVTILLKDFLKWSVSLKQVWKNLQEFLTTMVINFQYNMERLGLVVDKLLGKLDKPLKEAFAEAKKRRDETLATIVKDVELPDDTGAKKKAQTPASQKTIKTFADAAFAQSSKAFEILNPNQPSSIQGKQLKQQEEINKNTRKIANEMKNGGVQIARQDIPS
jgi:hypothetical protein